MEDRNFAHKLTARKSHNRRNRNSHHRQDANQFPSNYCNSRQQKILSGSITLVQDGIAVIKDIE